MTVVTHTLVVILSILVEKEKVSRNGIRVFILGRCIPGKWHVGVSNGKSTERGEGVQVLRKMKHKSFWKAFLEALSYTGLGVSVNMVAGGIIAIIRGHYVWGNILTIVAFLVATFPIAGFIFYDWDMDDRK